MHVFTICTVKASANGLLYDLSGQTAAEKIIVPSSSSWPLENLRNKSIHARKEGIW